MCQASEGEKPRDGIISRNREIEAQIAEIVFNSLRCADPEALMLGEPNDPDAPSGNVIIDGSFNFRIVAWRVRRALEKQGLL